MAENNRMANNVARRQDPGRALVRAADQRLPRYLAAADVRRLIDSATNPRDRMLLATLWNTGARIGEVLPARRGDFDPIGRCLRMLNEKRRRIAEKVVYLSPDFALALLAYCDARRLRGPDLLFPSRTGRLLDRVRAWRIVRAAADAAGIVEAHPHLFRHGAAIHLLRAGVPLPIVKDQLGHASILTTMIYTQFSDQDKRDLVGKVEF